MPPDCQDYLYMKTLIHAFVTSRLDFCNAILVGCTATVLTACSRSSMQRLVSYYRFRSYGRVTAAMRDVLHWLPVCQRIHFKLCYIVRNCVVGTAPAYLQERTLVFLSGKLRSVSGYVLRITVTFVSRVLPQIDLADEPFL